MSDIFLLNFILIYFHFEFITKKVRSVKSFSLDRYRPIFLLKLSYNYTRTNHQFCHIYNFSAVLVFSFSQKSSVFLTNSTNVSFLTSSPYSLFSIIPLIFRSPCAPIPRTSHFPLNARLSRSPPIPRISHFPPIPRISHFSSHAA